MEKWNLAELVCWLKRWVRFLSFMAVMGTGVLGQFPTIIGHLLENSVHPKVSGPFLFSKSWVTLNILISFGLWCNLWCRMQQFPKTLGDRGRSSVVREFEFKSNDPGFNPLTGQAEEQFVCPSESTFVQTCLCLAPSPPPPSYVRHAPKCVCTLN